MPLIRSLRSWLGRLVSDTAMTATTAADGGLGLGSASWLGPIVFIVLLPVVAVLVLIGLIYELVIRVDRRRLGSAAEWLISTAVTVGLLGGLYVAFVLR